MSDEEFLRKVVLLKRLGWLALFGAVIGVAGIAWSDPSTPPQWATLGFILVVPGMIYLLLVTMWHWKARYIGSHSNLWGGLLLLETSGWFKVVYLFRHIIPDARGSGRYVR
jgi:hypothetical protein